MGIETTMCVETAIYWPPSAPDSFGKPQFGTPCEVAVRWENKVEEFLTPEGETKFSHAVVYSILDFDVNGALLFGSLTMDVDQVDPFANTGAHLIRSFAKLPFLKSTTRFLRTSYL